MRRNSESLAVRPTSYRQLKQLLGERLEYMNANPTPGEAMLRNKLLVSHVDHIYQCIIGKYIVDFALPSRMVIIEVDGIKYGYNRELTLGMERRQFLKTLGFKIIQLPEKKIQSFKTRNLNHRKMAKRRAFNEALERANKPLKAHFLEPISETVVAIEALELRRLLDRQHKDLVSQAAAAPVRLIKAQVYEEE